MELQSGSSQELYSLMDAGFRPWIGGALEPRNNINGGKVLPLVIYKTALIPASRRRLTIRSKYFLLSERYHVVYSTHTTMPPWGTCALLCRDSATNRIGQASRTLGKNSAPGGE